MQGRRYLFSKGSDVLVGSTHAFEDKLDQESTWCVGLVMRSSFVVCKCKCGTQSQSIEVWLYRPGACRWIVDMSTAYERTAATVVLSSPNKKNYSEVRV